MVIIYPSGLTCCSISWCLYYYYLHLTSFKVYVFFHETFRKRMQMIPTRMRIYQELELESSSLLLLLVPRQCFFFNDEECFAKAFSSMTRQWRRVFFKRGPMVKNASICSLRHCLHCKMFYNVKVMSLLPWFSQHDFQCLLCGTVEGITGMRLIELWYFLVFALVSRIYNPGKWVKLFWTFNMRRASLA